MSDFDPDLDLDLDFDEDPLNPVTLEKRRKKRRKMNPDKQAADIIELMEEAIERNKDPLGKGMRVSNWRKMAKQEIAVSLRNAITDVRREEKQSGENAGRAFIRGGFMLLAAAASFLAFWGGIALVAKEYGLGMGLAAAGSALVLSMAFVWLGLTVEELGLEPGSKRSRTRQNGDSHLASHLTDLDGARRNGSDNGSAQRPSDTVFDPARIPPAPTRRWLRLG